MKRRLDELQGDSNMEGMIQNMELAFRMQTTTPQLVDLLKETQDTLDLYGVGNGKVSDKHSRACLLARKLSESGVRFVQVTRDGWDHYGDIRGNLPRLCQQTDQPVAGLINDLKQRGLLDDTLALWSGEFGRTPWSQDLSGTAPIDTHGREHQPESFCAWMAGGGIKGGFIRIFLFVCISVICRSRGRRVRLTLSLFVRRIPFRRSNFRHSNAGGQSGKRNIRSRVTRWSGSDSLRRSPTKPSDGWMDEGYGSCVFRDSRFSQLMSDSLVHFQDQRHFTSCFVVMPNHVHAVIRPIDGQELEVCLQRIKQYVALRVNRTLGREGELWEEESDDRIIRDEEHLWNVVQYIGKNPKKAKLPVDQWVRWIHPDWKAAGWDFIDD